MNIFFINTIGSDVWGGVESWMLRIGSFLRKNGHNIYFAGRHDGIFLQTIAQNGFETVPIRGSWDISPRTIIRLARYMNHKKIELLVVNTNRDLRLGGIAARLAHSKPVVINRRGLPAFKQKLRHKISAKLADFSLVPSQDLKKSLLEFGWIPSEKITVIPNFFDIERIRRLAEEPCDIMISSNEPVIGTVANLVGQKALHILLQAIAILNNGGTKCTGIIIGEGPLREKLIKLSKELGISQKILFTGFLKNPFPLVKRFFILALPSIFEPFGQVLLEAAALKIPAVASNVGGIPEVIVDGETGILVPQENPNALAKAIKSLLENEDLRAQMGEKAFARAKKFDVSVIAPDVEIFFKDAIKYGKHF